MMSERVIAACPQDRHHRIPPESRTETRKRHLSLLSPTCGRQRLRLWNLREIEVCDDGADELDVRVGVHARRFRERRAQRHAFREQAMEGSDARAAHGASVRAHSTRKEYVMREYELQESTASRARPR